MKLIAVVEDRGGMLFNHRRVSKDRVLIDKIKQIIQGHTLLVHPFSAELFPDAKADEHFLDTAGEDDFCFIENCSVKAYEERISDVYLFRWNRKYPADLFFDLPLDHFHMTGTEDFAGYSHDKITLETWKRVGETNE